MNMYITDTDTAIKCSHPKVEYIWKYGAMSVNPTGQMTFNVAVILNDGPRKKKLLWFIPIPVKPKMNGLYLNGTRRDFSGTDYHKVISEAEKFIASLN